jgi:hypothetical protein
MGQSNTVKIVLISIFIAKEFISLMLYACPVDADLLAYLPSGSKWSRLKKGQQLFVIIISFGMVCGAIIQIKDLFVSIIPIMARGGNNMTTIASYGINVGWLFDWFGENLFYTILVLVFSVITFMISQRYQAQLFKAQDETKELEKLIKPLYLVFDKYPKREDVSNSLIHQLSTPPHQWYVQKNGVSWLREVAEDAESVIQIMQEHRELAQLRLQELIDKYLEMRRSYLEQRPHYGADSFVRYYGDTQRILNEMVNLMKARYDELTKAK